MDTSNPIAMVYSLTGTVLVTDAQGDQRFLMQNESLYPGDTLSPDSDGAVLLLLADGQQLPLTEPIPLTLTHEIIAETAADRVAGGLTADTVETVLAALESGQDLSEVLEPPAAGWTGGGGSEEGHSFLRLARVVETFERAESENLISPPPEPLLPLNLQAAIPLDLSSDVLVSTPAPPVVDTPTPPTDDPQQPDGPVTPQDPQTPLDPVTPQPPVNTAPDALNDAYSLVEGGSLTIVGNGVLGNDSDSEGNPLTVTAMTPPSHGSLKMNSDGGFSYVHNGSETTADSFTYTISDGQGGSDTATVNLTIVPQNDAPDAVDDSYSLNEGATLTMAASGVLGNDSDADGNGLTVSSFTQPAHGSLTLNADGSFSYVHNGSETTADSFTYTVSDGQGGSDTATVNLTITPQNDAPGAVDDSYSLNEGATLTMAASGVLGNDTDADGNTLTVSSFTQPTHGTLTLNADGSFSYVHNGSETTADSFTYTVSDGQGGSDTATVSLTIVPQNDAPDAVDDSYSLNEGATLTMAASGVLGNDTDADGNGLTVSSFTQPAHGTLTLNADGGFSYVHNGSETTADSFTYTISDGQGASDTATVNLTIVPQNDAPDAVDDSYSLNEGATLTMAASGVLGNDSDADGNGLTVSSFTQPAHGSLTLNADGSFSYVHNGSETTADSFTYTVSDGQGGSDTATVSLTIVPQNDAPDAVDDSYSLNEGATLTMAASGVLGNDTDADGNGLTVSSFTQPTHGTLTLNADGRFSYVHNGSETTADSFTYTVSDGQGGTDTATVSLTIVPQNDAPNAVDDSYSLNEGATLTMAASGVLGNDTDADGNGLTVSSFTQPTHGTLTLNADGSFSYTHNGSETTADSFTYTVSDGQGASDTATVNLTIVPQNDAPDAVDDSYSLNEGATLTMAASGVLGNDTDADGNGLTVSSFTQPTHGTLTLNPDGSFSYVHNGSETTADSFTYTVSDGQGGSDTATVSLTIVPQNDAPDAVDDSYSLNEGATLTMAASGVLGNDTDADGNGLTVSSFTQPAHGTLTLNADGSFSYVHNGSETTADSFTYTVSDGQGGSDTATVSLTIVPQNDAPDAVDDSYSLNEGATLTMAASGVLGNDTDADGNGLTVSSFTQPTHGTLTLNADGSFSYVHNGSETTADSFTYTVSDGQGGSDTATVSLTIVPQNDAPNAVDDSYSLNEGATLTMAASGVLGNDSDADGNGLTVSSFTQPTHGMLTLNADGSFSYVHNGSETTADSFTYTVSDGQGGTDTATVSLTIVPQNDVPDAVDDSYSLNEGATLTMAASGVLGNDTDADGNTLTVSSFTQPTHGSLTLNADGSFSYTHNGSETTADSFTYTVSDGQGGSDTATVSLTIVPQNDAPDAVDDSYSLNEGATLTMNASGVLGNDTDADGNGLTVSSFTQPTHGTLTLNADGSFSYVHNGSETTSDSFTYTVSDSQGGTDTATVNLTIVPQNDAPDAVDDSYSLNEGATLTMAASGVLGNDNDADGNALTVSSFTQPAHGTLTLNPDGSFSYVHHGTDTTSDSFTYTVSDGQGGSDTATVNLTIIPTYDPIELDMTGSAGTVQDVGLLSAADQSETTQGGFKVSAPEGLVSLTIASVVITAAQLQAATTINPVNVVNTTQHQLEITGFNSATGWVDYSYTLNQPVQHAPGSDSAQVNFSVSALDNVGQTADGQLVVTQLDDQPEITSVAETQLAITGGELIDELTVNGSINFDPSADQPHAFSWDGINPGELTLHGRPVQVQMDNASRTLTASQDGDQIFQLQVSESLGSYQLSVSPDIFEEAAGLVALGLARGDNFVHSHSGPADDMITTQMWGYQNNPDGYQLSIVAWQNNSLGVSNHLMDPGDQLLMKFDRGVTEFSARIDGDGPVEFTYTLYADPDHIPELGDDDHRYNELPAGGISRTVTLNPGDQLSINAEVDGLNSFGILAISAETGSFCIVQDSMTAEYLTGQFELPFSAGFTVTDSDQDTASGDIRVQISGDAPDSNAGGSQGTASAGVMDDLIWATDETDVFEWQLSDVGTPGTPLIDKVLAFDKATVADGGDALNLSDLLGDSDLTDYLYFDLQGDNTVVHISTQGGFSGGFNAASVDQTIQLTNVDLVSGYVDANSQLVDQNTLIQDLMQQGKLITD